MAALFFVYSKYGVIHGYVPEFFQILCSRKSFATRVTFTIEVNSGCGLTQNYMNYSNEFFYTKEDLLSGLAESMCCPYSDQCYRKTDLFTEKMHDQL